MTYHSSHRQALRISDDLGSGQHACSNDNLLRCGAALDGNGSIFISRASALVGHGHGLAAFSHGIGHRDGGGLNGELSSILAGYGHGHVLGQVLTGNGEGASGLGAHFKGLGADAQLGNDGHVTSYLLIELDGLLARLVVAETVISVTGYTVEAQSGELVIVSALKSSDDSIAIVDGDAIGILGGILVLFQSISITALTYVFITSALQRLGGSIVSEINVFVGLYFTISDSDLNDII